MWNHIRRAVDDRQRPGQFILTGSAVPTDDITRHTGAARLTRLRMRPMSLFDIGRSTGTISLRAMLRGTEVRSADTGIVVGDIAEQVVVGGPAICNARSSSPCRPRATISKRFGASCGDGSLHLDFAR